MSNKKIIINYQFSIINSMILLFLFILSLSACDDNNKIDDNTITIGTFNISWMGDGINDEIPRTVADYQRIANIISQLNPDIMGLEEIENAAAMNKLLNYLPDYDFYIGTSGDKQNPCILYKKGIEINYQGEYTPLIVEQYKTRPGLIAKVRKGNFDFILMVVHLKSTSHYDSTAELEEYSRQLRTRQAGVISHWADSVLSLKIENDIIILGDFNDYPNRVTNPTLTAIANNQNLNFLTKDLKSCKFPMLDGIDHIVVSKDVVKRFQIGSLRLYDFYSSMTESEISKVSDHCPIIVNLNINTNY